MTEANVLGVDFDGTIAGYEKGWQGAPGEDPIKGAREALRAFVMKGYTIIIFSCRADNPQGVEDIRQWLLRHDMLQYVSDITHVKPRALAYIDDRGIAFRGDWLAAVQEVDRFAAKEREKQKGKHDGGDGFTHARPAQAH